MISQKAPRQRLRERRRYLSTVICFPIGFRSSSSTKPWIGSWLRANNLPLLVGDADLAVVGLGVQHGAWLLRFPRLSRRVFCRFFELQHLIRLAAVAVN